MWFDARVFFPLNSFVEHVWVIVCATAHYVSHNLTSNLTSYKRPLAVFTASQLYCVQCNIFSSTFVMGKHQLNSHCISIFGSRWSKYMKTTPRQLRFIFHFSSVAVICNIIWIQYSGSACKPGTWDMCILLSSLL